MNLVDPKISQKMHVARSQLGTALHLYLHDLDPVSVRVLASGGREIAEALAQTSEAKPFSDFIHELFPELTEKALRTLRNKVWNAMKHSTRKNGQARDDEHLLAGDWQHENETLLSEGWFKMGQTGIPLPIEAQVLNLWILAKHAPDEQLGENIAALFPLLKENRSKRAKAIADFCDQTSSRSRRSHGRGSNR